MTETPGISTGEAIGDWRHTGTRTNVEILAPGWYSYDNSEGNRIYKTAGKTLTDKASRYVFDRMRDRVITGDLPERAKGIFS